MGALRAEIALAFERIVAEACSPELVRAVETGADRRPLWDKLEASGFIDALVAEDAGGVGLSLEDAAPILELAGRHALPLPVAETVMLRGILTASRTPLPAGSIAFGGKAVEVNGGLVCRRVIAGAQADHVLCRIANEWRIISTVGAMVTDHGTDATLELTVDENSVAFVPAVDPLLAEALVRALQMAGAAAAALDRTLAYANDRRQFGRSIGKFQAIQHQLAVMAEQVFAAQMAATLATGDGITLDPLRVAIAKARTGEAAAVVAALAHAIHGAIGFTREYDLQLVTRRLNAWRRAAGGDATWQARIGAAAIGLEGPALDLLRNVTDGAASTLAPSALGEER